MQFGPLISIFLASCAYTIQGELWTQE